MLLRASIGLAVAAALFAALQSWRVNDLRDRLAAAERRFDQCDATLQAYLEGEEIDDAIPDDLGGFDVPSEWMRDLPASPAAP